MRVCTDRDVVLRAGIVCSLILLGPTVTVVMSTPREIIGCSSPVGGDAGLDLRVEAGVDRGANDAGVAEADARIFVLPDVDGGDGATPLPL